MKQLKIIFVIAILLQGLVLPSVTAQTVSDEVYFADANLERVIKENLNIEVITEEALLELTYLDIYEDHISDVTGLEYAHNLEHFAIYERHSVSDLTPLTGLTNLVALTIQGGHLENLELLAELEQLERLHLFDNAIRDISVLASLPNLWEVGLANNDINNISALKDLSNLRYVNFNSNNISDISMLKEFEALEFVELFNNNLDMTPQSPSYQVVHQLLDREITVFYDEMITLDITEETENSVSIEWSYDIPNRFVSDSSWLMINESFVPDVNVKEQNAYTFTNLDPDDQYRIIIQFNIYALGNSYPLDTGFIYRPGDFVLDNPINNEVISVSPDQTTGIATVGNEELEQLLDNGEVSVSANHLQEFMLELTSEQVNLLKEKNATLFLSSELGGFGINANNLANDKQATLILSTVNRAPQGSQAVSKILKYEITQDSVELTELSIPGKAIFLFFDFQNRDESRVNLYKLNNNGWEQRQMSNVDFLGFGLFTDINETGTYGIFERAPVNRTVTQPVQTEDNNWVVNEELVNEVEENAVLSVDLELAQGDALAKVPFTSAQIQSLKAKNAEVELDRRNASMRIPLSNLTDADVETTFSMEKLEDVPQQADALSEVYSFKIFQGEQAVTSFEAPVTLTFTYDESRLAENEEAVVGYLNEQNEWTFTNNGVEFVNDTDGTITVTTNHFSTFGVFAVEVNSTEPPEEEVNQEGPDLPESEVDPVTDSDDEERNNQPGPGNTNQPEGSNPIDTENENTESGITEERTSENETVITDNENIESEKEEQEISTEEETTESVEEGKKLPKTATDSYNLFVIGSLLAIAGAFFYVIQRRRVITK
ncbi:LPXTG cell wall anchor domain-containing protein [Alkalihalobacterium bogoriense]|uniref:LPXTG cell wall anchor domain-containing protein n=1 Tax=Alkalihalobacterium bogoriense TaxID=246272 RepID=UPI00047AEA92|nr:LPXTG cell wall anchor domain-containing protein [Alkalihalobacterium bogoriense]